MISEPRGPLSAGLIAILAEEPRPDPVGLIEWLLIIEDVIDDGFQLALIRCKGCTTEGRAASRTPGYCIPGRIGICHMLEGPFEAGLRPILGASPILEPTTPERRSDVRAINDPAADANEHAYRA